MNQYIVTFTITDKMLLSDDNEAFVRERVITNAAVDYDVSEEDVEIIEVKLLN